MPVWRRFSALIQTSHGAHLISHIFGTESFPGGKAAGAWRWPPTPSKAAVTKTNKAVSILHLWAVVAYYKPKFTFTFNTILSHTNSIRALTSYFLEVCFIVSLSRLHFLVPRGHHIFAPWPHPFIHSSLLLLCHTLPLILMQQNIIVYVPITSWCPHSAKRLHLIHVSLNYMLLKHFLSRTLLGAQGPHKARHCNTRCWGSVMT